MNPNTNLPEQARRRDLVPGQVVEPSAQQAHLARAAYEAYCDQTDGKSLATGDDLPAWEQLPEAIQQAWAAAAMGALDHFLDAAIDVLGTARPIVIGSQRASCSGACHGCRRES